MNTIYVTMLIKEACTLQLIALFCFRCSETDDYFEGLIKGAPWASSNGHGPAAEGVDDNSGLDLTQHGLNQAQLV